MVSGRLTVSKEILGGVGKIRNRPQATIAVWNITNVCNLKCKHCYANSEARDEGELTTEEALRVVDELRELGVKILIFSGGEPLLREDIYDICGHAARKGLVVLVSSNGTTINDDDILQIKRAGIRYVGISIDGSRRTHDNFRGVTGSFDKAVEALKMLKAGNVRTGVRFTVVKYNLPDLPAIIKLLEKIGVPRLCVYHLVYSGRALNMAGEDLSPAERREMLDFLLAKAIEWRELDAEIETVASPADGVYAYLWLKEKYPEFAEDAARYLELRGGDPSAHRLISIDHLGNVHPNQFWWDYTLGNIRERSLAEIWYNSGDSFFRKLKRKHKYVKGRCGRCIFKKVCGGFRLRALRVYGDPWEEDPACYLSDKEVATR
jgi:radical SAM protein with 4Fe4S-binding SPASM domain